MTPDHHSAAGTILQYPSVFRLEPANGTSQSDCDVLRQSGLMSPATVAFQNLLASVPSPTIQRNITVSSLCQSQLEPTYLPGVPACSAPDLHHIGLRHGGASGARTASFRSVAVRNTHLTIAGGTHALTPSPSNTVGHAKPRALSGNGGSQFSRRPTCWCRTRRSSQPGSIQL